VSINSEEVHVKPGDGRIKACVADRFGDLSGACIKVLAEPKPAVMSDGANAQPKHIENSHLTRFAEIFLAAIDPSTGDVVAEGYGTYAMPKIPANGDSAPQAKIAALNMQQIKKQYGVLGASLNGRRFGYPALST
jgi:hypothetical protein